MKMIWGQLDLEVTSYLPTETSAEVSGRRAFVEQFETGVNQDEVLSRDLQRMRALIERRQLHLQVPAACTSQKPPQLKLSLDGFLSFSSCSNSEKQTAACVRS